jgi:integrase
MIVRKVLKTFHIDWIKGVRVRRSLGTRSEDVARRLKSRIENAVAEGPNSPTWIELVDVLPPRTYACFEQALGIKRAKLYTWDELHGAFLEDAALRVKAKTLSQGTVDRYKSVIRRFEAFWETQERRLALLRDLQEDAAWVRNFKPWCVKEIEKNGGTGAGLQMDLSTLHTVFQFAIDEGMMSKHPVRVKYKRIENPDRGADPYTVDQLVRLRRHADDDKMVFLVFRHTGLRIGDATLFSFEHVDFATSEMDIITQKFKKRVILPLPPELMTAMRIERERRNAGPQDRILINPKNNGRPFSAGALYDHVVALGDRAEVHACPHRFRDTKALDLFLSGADTPDVAQSLGDTEEVIRKHYAKWTPERRERLRRFTENGLGIEGHKYTVSPEESSTDIQEKEPCPTVEPQLPAPSEKAAATVLDSNFSETAPEESLQREHSAATVVLPASGQTGGAFEESCIAVPESKAVAVRCTGVPRHGTRTAYDRGCRCEQCKALTSERMKNYRARLKAEGREPMVTLICDGCGIEFKRKQGNGPTAKGHRHAFHSPSCSKNWLSNRDRGAVIHGTRTVYDRDGCRCEKCVAVHSEHMKKYRIAARARKQAALVQGLSGTTEHHEVAATERDTPAPFASIQSELISGEECA